MENLSNLRTVLKNIKPNSSLESILTSYIDIIQITKYYNNEDSKKLMELVILTAKQYKFDFNVIQLLKITDYYFSIKEIGSAIFYYKKIKKTSTINEKCELNRLNFLLSNYLKNPLSEKTINDYIYDYEQSNKRPLYYSIYYELYRRNLHNFYKAMFYYKMETAEKYNQDMRIAICNQILPFNIYTNTKKSTLNHLSKLENDLKTLQKNRSYAYYAFALCKICLIYIEIGDLIMVKHFYNKAKFFDQYIRTGAFKIRLIELEANMHLYSKNFKEAIAMFKQIEINKFTNKIYYHLAMTCLNIGVSFLNLQQLYGAKYYLLKTLNHSLKNKYDNILLLALQHLTSYYKLIEDYKLALYFSEIYNTTKQDIEKNGRLLYFKKIALHKQYSNSRQSNHNDKLINDIYKFIDLNLCNELLSVPFICKNLGFSKMTISRKLKLKGMPSLGRLILIRRLDWSNKLIKTNKELQIKEIAYMSGFNSVEVFSRTYKKHFGTNPSDTKSQIKDTIHHL